MKFSQKLLIIAKGVGLWWGIYFILGCCLGFALNMAMDFLMVLSGVFEMKRYFPIMIACTFAAAVITYFATEAVKLVPKSILRRKLQKRLDEEGFSDGLTSELLSHASGENKNHMLVEAATVYCIRGEILAAEEALHRVDLISVLDIAQSTGKLRTAAYYYCVEMTLCILKSDRDGAAHVYDDGVYYLEAFPEDDRILTVLALYQTTAGLYESALETLQKITWSTLPKKLKRYGEAICDAIAAVNLVDLERNDEAVEKAKSAIMCKCSQYITEFARGIIDRAEEASKNEVKETDKSDDAASEKESDTDKTAEGTKEDDETADDEKTVRNNETDEITYS